MCLQSPAMSDCIFSCEIAIIALTSSPKTPVLLTSDENNLLHHCTLNSHGFTMHNRINVCLSHEPKFVIPSTIDRSDQVQHRTSCKNTHNMSLISGDCGRVPRDRFCSVRRACVLHILIEADIPERQLRTIQLAENKVHGVVKLRQKERQHFLSGF